VINLINSHQYSVSHFQDIHLCSHWNISKMSPSL